MTSSLNVVLPQNSKLDHPKISPSSNDAYIEPIHTPAIAADKARAFALLSGLNISSTNSSASDSVYVTRSGKSITV